MPLQLIVGLANPGKEYADTRHNVGAWWLQAVCTQFDINLQTQSKLLAAVGQQHIGTNKIRCVIPTTYMNHSGQALQKVAQYYNVASEDILVAHDELDFPAGTVRIKFGGGHGGHNGLRDIIAQLGTDKFHRLRIGIGHPGDRDLVSDYVLSNPSKSDRDLIQNSIQNSMLLFPTMLAGDWPEVMNKLHQN